MKNRLPIHHPEYQYPLSRNPYWKLLQEISDYVQMDGEAEKNRGNWRNLFKADTPLDAKLHVEIGCNGGHWILGQAARHPEQRFIGIDWKPKQIFKAYEKLQKKELKNILFLRVHARRLPYLFSPSEIDQLYLFFPDPWPKKAQKKNRLVQIDWLQEISPLIHPQGAFEIRTDHSEYFSWIQNCLQSENNTHFQLIEFSQDYYKDHSNPQDLVPPDVTLFERVFIREGLPIHRLLLRTC